MSGKAFDTRSPLSRARGLGPAKEGVAHWWAQRVTAAALVPMTLWFVVSVILLAGAEHATVVAWVGSPVTTVALLLLIAAVFHHAQLGLQVVIEDYVHNEGLKIAGLLVIKAAALVLAIGAAFAVLRIALG
ncbi:MAG: succinate dehydrogenase, hydrophobic membrane anchor protein [Rhodospirillales bacterium]|nr:succinate dehydrogenase, hydrophobic membrane anchor protein [Rhodospirillales bacterium]